MRVVHLLTPRTMNNVNGTPRHSNHRQGNCMNCNLGRISHRRLLIDSINSAHAAPQAASEYHSSRLGALRARANELRANQVRAPQAAANVNRISATASQEMTRLKASWSAMPVWTNKK